MPHVSQLLVCMVTIGILIERKLYLFHRSSQVRGAAPQLGDKGFDASLVALELSLLTDYVGRTTNLANQPIRDRRRIAAASAKYYKVNASWSMNTSHRSTCGRPLTRALNFLHHPY